MTNILQILLGLALVNYFMFDVVSAAPTPTANSAQLKKAFAIAGATAVAFLATLVLSTLFEHFVLIRFMQSFLSILVFVVILAGVIQVIIPLLPTRYFPLAPLPGIWLPLIFGNCVLIGVTMPETSSIALNEIFVSGFLRCSGFAAVLVCFTALTQRFDGSAIPAALRGVPATLLTAALVSMTFMGFAGVA